MLRTQHCVLILSLAFLVACAQQETAPVASSNSQCELTAAELEQVKANAFDYLPEKWPVVDKQCEAIFDNVAAVAAGKCAIAGGPKPGAGCAAALHEGFSIVFDRETLEPEAIHFKTE